MSDTAAQFRASLEAQDKVLELLRAAEEILVHGNRLFNDVRDIDAWLATTEANTRVVIALTEFIKIVRAHDVET